MSPLVSVIIPTFNYAHYLLEAIQSVLVQTLTDYEIIVVDGGSTDSTRSVAAQFEDRVRYLYKPSPSPNNSRNEGIRAAQGRYVAFLDADDKWLPDKLTLQVPLFEANPSVGLVYATVISFESTTGALINHFPVSRCRRGNVLHDLYLDQFVSSPTPLIRREVFDQVGLFAENRKYTDDWEMWLRIAARYEFDFVPQPLALYRLHPSASSLKTASYTARIEEMLDFFEVAAEHYPELRCLKALRRSTFLEWMGWRLVTRSQISIGRRHLWNAIRAMPTRVKPYLLLALSYLGGRATFANFQDSELAYVRGKYHLFNLHLAQARKSFWQAICLGPFYRAQSYLGLLLTFCGRRIVQQVRQRSRVEYFVGSPAPGDSLSLTQW